MTAVRATSSPAAPAASDEDAARASRSSTGSLTLLTIYIAFLFVLPARLVVAPLGGVGRPEVLIALIGLFWWIVQHAVPGALPRGRQPVRYLLYGYLVVFMLAYLAGLDRRLPGDEARAMDRALIATLALAGVALLILDGIRTRRQLDALLRRLTYGGAFMASLGAVHFLTGFDLVSRISLPGLSLNSNLFGVGTRGAPGFRRVAGTAGHPIEFGVVAALLVPIALHYALHARTRGQRRVAWPVLVVLLLAVPFSISRSGTLALFVVFLVMIPIWSGVVIRRAVVCALLGSLLLRSALPGLLGTVKSLFLNLGTDPSIQGRTNDYDDAFRFIAERPLLGRGPRTFIPEKYFVLDNEMLYTLITTGYVGLAALVALFFGTFFTARSTYRRSRDDTARHLAQSLAASSLGAFVVLFTFDGFSFTLYSATVFIVVGAVGALWRIDRAGGDPSEVPVPPALPVLARPRRAAPVEPAVAPPR